MNLDILFEALGAFDRESKSNRGTPSSLLLVKMAQPAEQPNARAEDGDSGRQIDEMTNALRNALRAPFKAIQLVRDEVAEMQAQNRRNHVMWVSYSRGSLNLLLTMREHQLNERDYAHAKHARTRTHRAAVQPRD